VRLLTPDFSLLLFNYSSIIIWEAINA
jgi:hypothetical protein